MIDRFCIARPSFRVAESGSFGEHTLLDRSHTGGGLGREEIIALLQPQRASSMSSVADFRQISSPTAQGRVLPQIV